MSANGGREFLDILEGHFFGGMFVYEYYKSKVIYCLNKWNVQIFHFFNFFLIYTYVIINNIYTRQDIISAICLDVGTIASGITPINTSFVIRMAW